MTSHWSNRSGLKLEKFSPDHLFNHKITVSQPEKGYRFSMDPFILASHVKAEETSKIIDIGCGCGIMPLILSSRFPELNIIGVEIQEELSRFAKQNIVANQLEKTIQIIHDDIKNIKPCDIKGKADIIVSNPPYKKKNTGRLNPDSQKAIARHEVTLDIDSLFDCSNRLLKTHGKIYFIFPSDRLSEVILTMDRYGFGLDTIRFVHIKKDTPARLVIVCGKKDSQQNCIVEPPLYIYSSKNKFTEEFFQYTGRGMCCDSCGCTFTD